jgi:hypothetical protein
MIIALPCATLLIVGLILLGLLCAWHELEQ